MAGQQYATAPSRNPAVAAEGFAGGAKPGIVPAPQGRVTLGVDPGNTPGKASPGAQTTGFSGTAVIAGKIKV